MTLPYQSLLVARTSFGPLRFDLSVSKIPLDQKNLIIEWKRRDR
jgi:hypothetical protein